MMLSCFLSPKVLVFAVVAASDLVTSPILSYVLLARLTAESVGFSIQMKRGRGLYCAINVYQLIFRAGKRAQNFKLWRSVPVIADFHGDSPILTLSFARKLLQMQRNNFYLVILAKKTGRLDRK